MCLIEVCIQRKRHQLALKKKRCLKRKEQADNYAKLLAQRKKESKARRQEELQRRRSASMRDSKSSQQSKQTCKLKNTPIKSSQPLLFYNYCILVIQIQDQNYKWCLFYGILFITLYILKSCFILNIHRFIFLYQVSYYFYIFCML